MILAAQSKNISNTNINEHHLSNEWKTYRRGDIQKFALAGIIMIPQTDKPIDKVTPIYKFLTSTQTLQHVIIIWK